MKNGQQSYIDQYSQHGILGEGGQASVYLCRNKNYFYAAKVYYPGASKAQAFKKEVEFLSKIHSKNLINMISSNIETKVKFLCQKQDVRPVIILEYAQNGDLFDYIKNGVRFSPEMCRTITKNILQAVRNLHSMGISHRDLKPENILFDRDFILKVSDFGLSTLIKGHDGDGFLYTHLGTKGYRPPEMEEGKYQGDQADIFAVGVILFLLYSGNPPFMSTKSKDPIYKLIQKKNFAKFWLTHQQNKPPNFYPKSFKRLINCFFSAEIEQRPTLESLQKDDWLIEESLSQEEFATEMKQKFEQLLKKDEERKKVFEKRLQILKNVMEQQKNFHEKQIHDPQEGKSIASKPEQLGWQRQEEQRTQKLVCGIAEQL